MWTHCVKEPSVHLNSSRVVLWWAHFPNERKKGSKKSRNCTGTGKGKLQTWRTCNNELPSLVAIEWCWLQRDQQKVIKLYCNWTNYSVRFGFDINEIETRKIMKKLSLFSAKAAAAAVNFNQQNLKWILLFLVLHIFLLNRLILITFVHVSTEKFWNDVKIIEKIWLKQRVEACLFHTASPYYFYAM